MFHRFPDFGGGQKLTQFHRGCLPVTNTQTLSICNARTYSPHSVQYSTTVCVAIVSMMYANDMGFGAVRVRCRTCKCLRIFLSFHCIDQRSLSRLYQKCLQHGLAKCFRCSAALKACVKHSPQVHVDFPLVLPLFSLRHAGQLLQNLGWHFVQCQVSRSSSFCGHCL